MFRILQQVTLEFDFGKAISYMGCSYQRAQIFQVLADKKKEIDGR